MVMMVTGRVMFVALLFALMICSNVPVILAGLAVKSGNCPLKMSIKNCTPKCWSDFECSGTQRCCSNVCGSNSCTDVSSIFSGNDPHREQKDSIYCGGIRCRNGQKCIDNGPMKRPKCV